MSMPPTLEAKTYRAMYAFGNHLCVSSGEKHLITRNSSIVAMFEQECVLRPNYQQPILVKLEYVGWIEEILELHYGVFNIIVFFCNWVKANFTWNSATIKRNKYSFTFDNFNSLIPIFDQSFAFPIHVRVFFYANPKEKRWKIVIHKNPCGKQVVGGVDFDPNDLDMFRIKNDDSHIGLQAPISILEVTQIATIVGRVPFMIVDLVHVATIGRNQDSHDSDPQSADEFDGQNNFDNDG
jgi:hypothetical protein